MSQFVTLVNRTSRTLEGMWDGKTHTVAPKSRNSLPLIVADAIKRKNPIMGSDDKLTGQFQYLVGIEEQGDDCSPIEQSDEIELYNRSNYRNAVPIVIVPGNTGMYSVKRNDVAAPQPLDSAFVKP